MMEPIFEFIGFGICVYLVYLFRILKTSSDEDQQPYAHRYSQPRRATDEHDPFTGRRNSPNSGPTRGTKNSTNDTVLVTLPSDMFSKGAIKRTLIGILVGGVFGLMLAPVMYTIGLYPICLVTIAIAFESSASLYLIIPGERITHGEFLSRIEPITHLGALCLIGGTRPCLAALVGSFGLGYIMYHSYHERNPSSSLINQRAGNH